MSRIYKKLLKSNKKKMEISMEKQTKFINKEPQKAKKLMKNSQTQVVR